MLQSGKWKWIRKTALSSSPFVATQNTAIVFCNFPKASGLFSFDVFGVPSIICIAYILGISTESL